MPASIMDVVPDMDIVSVIAMLPPIMLMPPPIVACIWFIMSAIRPVTAIIDGAIVSLSPSGDDCI